MRSRPRRRTALLVSTLAALLGAELVLRGVAARRNRNTLEQAFAEEQRPEPGERVGLIDIIRMSPNSSIVYELKPNIADLEFKGGRLSTNEHGFRGAPIPPAGPGTVTIVGLGDSILFGHGVSDDETFLACLEERLRAERPGVEWRVINTGVPGYNTRMEVETLRAKALAFEPRLVVLSLVPNDLVLPIYVRQTEDVADLGRSFLLERLVELFGERPVATSVAARAGRDPRLARAPRLDDADTIPRRYRHLAGWESFVTALDLLAELSAEHGFDVVTCSTIETPLLGEFVRETTARGWPHVALLDRIDAYLREHGGGRFDAEETGPYERSALVVGPSNPHPSALQHRMLADDLWAHLESSGLLDRLTVTN